jgi:drug/metabolite transporter (DMT)-like permease
MVPRPSRAACVVAALPVLWFAQGSTFVVIRMGVAALPPFLLSGVRFLVVGALLLVWSGWRAGWRLRITRQEALLGVISGLGIILAGQGSASWSSQYLAPGAVAVLASTIPLWAALFAWLGFGARLGGAAGALGLLAGFAGVAFVAWPASGSGMAPGPALLVVAGAAAWGAAVVVVSRSGRLRRPLLVTGLQALNGGALQLAAGFATGEAAQVVQSHLLPSIPVFAYLVVVSSLVGYPLLTWLLSEVPVHVANTGAYVAPVIALVLGSLLLAERVTPRMAGGVAVILAGVALMVWSSRASREPVEAREAAA